MAQKNQLNLSVSEEVLETLERITAKYKKPSRNFAGAEALEMLLPFYEQVLQKQHDLIAEVGEEFIRQSQKPKLEQGFRNAQPAPVEQQLEVLSKETQRKRKLG